MPAAAASVVLLRDELAGVALVLPAAVAGTGRAAANATLEFFAARLSNPHTRRAYLAAVHRFGRWCERRRLTLDGLTPTRLAAYVQDLQASVSLASLKLHAAALRHWLDYLTERGLLDSNPARSVRTPRLVVREGKTPVLEREEARRLFNELDRAVRGPRALLALRDRALLGVMLFGFVRIGAALRMRVRDFEGDGARASLVLHEKGGKERRIPCHHQALGYLREYIAAAGLEAGEPLFQSAPHRRNALSGRALDAGAAWSMVKRRCLQAKLPSHLTNHSFRATGLTLHQQNGGRLEDAQALAGHADARTTRLYIRQRRELAQREVERVQI